MYVDGFVIAVPTANKEAYRESAEKGWALYKEYGAQSVCECWGDDVPEGKVTSFPMAVKLGPDETVVFSWLVWPDKESRDRCMASVETDPRWQELGMPFDGRRVILGGFRPIFSA